MDINSTSNNFKIKGKINKNELSLVMEVPENGHVTTNSLPLTQKLLSKHLPTIFKCQCFNEANKNFREESRNTEIGHLFEHIMLEYLCIGKIAEGNTDAVYEGRTNWNWEKDAIGTFYVEIKIGVSESKIIKKAFNKSVKLLQKIYKN